MESLADQNDDLVGLVQGEHHAHMITATDALWARTWHGNLSQQLMLELGRLRRPVHLAEV